MKPIKTKSGTIHPRYSNYDPYEIGAPSAADFGLPGGSSGSLLSGSTSGSGMFDVTGIVTNLINALSNTATAIWGKGDKYRVQALQYINDEKSKTTKILWVVVALMAVVGAVILIKKTK